MELASIKVLNQTNRDEPSDGTESTWSIGRGGYLIQPTELIMKQG